MTQFTSGATSTLDSLTVTGATALTQGQTVGSAPMPTPSGTAPLYGCRAWCVFDGTLTGTNAPTAGGNVTSVTRNGAGDYTINFTAAMPDALYSFCASAKAQAAGAVSPVAVEREFTTAKTVSALRIVTKQGSTVSDVSTEVSIAIFR
jgi:hypothetical protein